MKWGSEECVLDLRFPSTLGVFVQTNCVRVHTRTSSAGLCSGSSVQQRELVSCSVALTAFTVLSKLNASIKRERANWTQSQLSGAGSEINVSTTTSQTGCTGQEEFRKRCWQHSEKTAVWDVQNRNPCLKNVLFNYDTLTWCQTY